jgi:hypothetical protein
MSKKSKTKKLLDEASYYTGAQSGNQTPETISAYEFSRDSVPTLNKLGDLKNQAPGQLQPQELPFPLQDSLRELAEIYIKSQGLRNKAREAAGLPLFKGREAELDAFRKSLNGMMVECKKLAAELQKFSLAAHHKQS